jgi:hypothetical protein
MSASHFLLPRDEEKLERVRIALERKGVFEFCDGLSDLGSIAMVYSMSHEHHISSTKEMIELGSKVMQKKLHLDGIVKEYDTEDKSTWCFSDRDDIGPSDLVPHTPDSMTQ